MMHMRQCLRAAALAALAALLPASATAGTTWEVLQGFGWTGSWAVSCNEPPNGSNIWTIVFAQADGSVRRNLDRGGGSILMGTVDSAQIAAGNMLQARLRNDDAKWGAGNGLYFDVIMQKSDNGGIRAFQSKGSDGKQYVKDGVFAVTGNPSSWSYKCRE
jgi:hypothetical protein